MKLIFWGLGAVLVHSTSQGCVDCNLCCCSDTATKNPVAPQRPLWTREVREKRLRHTSTAFRCPFCIPENASCSHSRLYTRDVELIVFLYSLKLVTVEVISACETRHPPKFAPLPLLPRHRPLTAISIPIKSAHGFETPDSVH